MENDSVLDISPIRETRFFTQGLEGFLDEVPLGDWLASVSEYEPMTYRSGLSIKDLFHTGSDGNILRLFLFGDLEREKRAGNLAYILWICPEISIWNMRACMWSVRDSPTDFRKREGAEILLLTKLP